MSDGPNKNRWPGGAADAAPDPEAGDAKTSAPPFSFAAFRYAWLDQVAADDELPPIAFKLAWHLMKDCGRTFKRTGDIYSFRGQDSLGELLKVDPRYVRTLVDKLVEDRHLGKKRGGKGNPNRMFPKLFDRNSCSDQEDALTGTSDPFDRNSSVILTGTAVPPILIEDIYEEKQGGHKARPTASSSSTIEKDPSSTFEGSSGRAPNGASTNGEPLYSGLEIDHPKFGKIDILETYPDERVALIRSQETGETARVRVGDKYCFKDGPGGPASHPASPRRIDERRRDSGAA